MNTLKVGEYFISPRYKITGEFDNFLIEQVKSIDGDVINKDKGVLSSSVDQCYRLDQFAKCYSSNWNELSELESLHYKIDTMFKVFCAGDLSGTRKEKSYKDVTDFLNWMKNY